MKKPIFLLCLISTIIVVGSSCGRNSKKAKQAELERIQRMQDSARQADAAIMMQLQMKAKMDSMSALSSIAAKEFSSNRSSSSNYSSFYVIIGSFLNRSNAVEFMQFVKQIFPDASVLRYGRWNMVTVGGTYSNFSLANRALGRVKERLADLYSSGGSGGDGEDEDYDEEDGGDEEEDMSDDEEDAGDEFGEEEGDEVEGAEGDAPSRSFSGTPAAWVLGM
ncbi:MAG: SPOR domain-containing protein [Bacteroidales bacterium]